MSQNAVTSLGDTFTRFLTKAVNMLPVREMEDRKTTLHDLEEIEELNINEERITELNSEIGELRNWEIARERTTSKIY